MIFRAKDYRRIVPGLSIGSEPIIKPDGAVKSDCERSASKRLLERIRREHPKMKLIVVGDALISNEPHLSLPQELGMRFIISETVALVRRAGR